MMKSLYQRTEFNAMKFVSSLKILSKLGSKPARVQSLMTKNPCLKKVERTVSPVICIVCIVYIVELRFDCKSNVHTVDF